MERVFFRTTEPEKEVDTYENISPRFNSSREISIEETRDAIKRMRNGKSPASDGISVELLKGNENAAIWLTRIFNVAWCEGRVPEDWGKAIICKVPKKGVKQNVKIGEGYPSYHMWEKKYERKLEKRLRAVVEEKLEEGQYDFRQERGTTGAIFTLKILMEKCWEWDQPLYIAFIGLEKAFNRLPRNIIWETLENPAYGVDRTLIKAIKSLYRNCVSAVRTQTREDNWLDVNMGVGQRGVISPLLFILFMDRCMKGLRLGGVTTLAYGDGIVLVTYKPNELQNALSEWNNVLKAAKMKIIVGKTKVMIIEKQKKIIRNTARS